MPSLMTTRAVIVSCPAGKPSARVKIIAGATLGIAMILAPPISKIAKAEILEYQIRRLIRFDSSCEILTLKRELGEHGGFIYYGICDNTTFYPDGIIVLCNDRDDETSCKVQTKSREFKFLEAMRPSGAPDAKADVDDVSK